MVEPSAWSRRPNNAIVQDVRSGVTGLLVEHIPIQYVYSNTAALTSATELA